MGLTDKKKPIGTAKSDKKNVVSYTSKKYGSTAEVDTSGFSSGAKKFNASIKYPAGSLSNREARGSQVKEGAVKDFVTNRRGASRIIAAGKTLGINNIILPTKGGTSSRPDTPLAATPKPKKNN